MTSVPRVLREDAPSIRRFMALALQESAVERLICETVGEALDLLAQGGVAPVAWPRHCYPWTAWLTARWRPLQRPQRPRPTAVSRLKERLSAPCQRRRPEPFHTTRFS